MAKTKAENPGDVDTKKAEKNRVKRIPYVESEGAQVDGEGLLTVVPTDFDTAKHKAPNRKHFATEDLYCEFRAIILETKVTAYTELAMKLRTQAEQIRQFGDPGQRAKVRRAQKLTDQLKALRDQLKSEGVEVDLKALLGDG